MTLPGLSSSDTPRPERSGPADFGLEPSAHIDTFARDHLPPRDSWPALIFETPELRYPPRLNCATELLDGMVAVASGRSSRLGAATGESSGRR